MRNMRIFKVGMLVLQLGGCVDFDYFKVSDEI